jgi:hypothetical protein
MQVFIVMGENNRITGINPNDMSGNSGWLETTDTALTTRIGVDYDEMFSRLSEEHGVALYKFVNGYGENRTAEEIAADIAAIPVPQPSETEQLRTRVVELESVIDALIGGDSNG